ncbi:TPA: AraC family transcriptional regulator, partial [Escherichia coli]|nr:AraC family transcriptional regulator [Escherichia coli]
TEIAHQLCFDSLQSFSREFKKLFGISPCRYRHTAEWLLNNIQPPIRFDEVELPPLRIMELPKRDFIGYEFLYNETLGVKSHICSNLRLEHVMKNKSLNKGEDFYMISKVIPELTLDNKFEVKVFAGFENDKVSNNSMLKKYSSVSGLYACFNFSKRWNHYSSVFEKIYLEVLPSYGLKRAEGDDIECFNGGKRNDYDSIFNIDYYIPVCY